MRVKGYKIYGPLKLGEFIADIIGVRNKDDVVAIEVKPGNASEIRKGLGQAQTYLDYVHQVFLAIPEDYSNVGDKVTRHTKVGLLLKFGKNCISIRKNPEYTKPLEENLASVLSKTTGFCWICGRTFNTVPKDKTPYYLAHKDIDKDIFEGLVKSLMAKPKTKGYWVHICKVCSRIIYHTNTEFLRTVVFGKGEYSKVKFEKFWYEDLSKFFKSKCK